MHASGQCATICSHTVPYAIPQLPYAQVRYSPYMSSYIDGIETLFASRDGFRYEVEPRQRFRLVSESGLRGLEGVEVIQGPSNEL